MDIENICSQMFTERTTKDYTCTRRNKTHAEGTHCKEQQ